MATNSTTSNKRPTTTTEQNKRLCTSYEKDPRTTGGLKGLLYETKLISLMLFRLRRNDDIEQFYLASNFHKIGGFDDICLKIRAKGYERPIFVFIQAKHKENYDDKKHNNDEAYLDYNLFEKLRDSLEKIKGKFDSSVAANQSNEFFSGIFSEIDCMFILYTNSNSTKLHLPPGSELSIQGGVHSFGDVVNNLIATSTAIPQTVVHCGEKVVLYKNQGNHNEVEEILKHEIEEHLRLSHNNVIQHDQETIFLHYHYRVQEWWMRKKRDWLAECITTDDDLYQETIQMINTEPLMSKMHMLYIEDVLYYQYDFSPDAMEAFNQSINQIYSFKHSTAILLTDFPTLRTMKVIRSDYLRKYYNNTYSVIDLERMLDLREKDFDALIEELRRTNKVLVIVWNNTKGRLLDERLKNLAGVTLDKKLIIIADNKLNETIKQYFDRDSVVMGKDCLTDSLKDLTPESLKEIIKDRDVIFQGQKVSLTLLMDRSVAYIKEYVFKKILRKEDLFIGKSLIDEKYEEIKHLYIDRKVCRAANVSYIINTGTDMCYRADYSTVKKFDDIKANVVLLTSISGMGKSTLLTHMSHNTNESDVKFWIVRVNLLEHTKEFEHFQKKTAAMDILTTLNFICKVTFKNDILGIRLEESDRKVHLVEFQGNDEATFEVNLFLHFFNERKLILLFDGFDEICADHKENVLKLFKVVKYDIRRNKMWVTSRPYREVLPDLENVLGKAYLLQCFSCEEEQVYLEKFWSNKISLESLSDEPRTTIIRTLESVENKLSGTIDFVSIYSNLITFLELRGINRFAATQQPNDIKQRDTIVNEFTGIPLLLYLTADYFSNLVINFDGITLGDQINTFYVYEKFIENKLIIFFKNKYHAELSMSYYKKQYKKELNDSIARYKKIAIYAIFRHSLFHDDCHIAEFNNTVFSKESLKEIETILKSFEKDDDTSGIISFVTSNNEPVFIHWTFREYLANEAICEIFRSNIDNRIKKLLLVAIHLYHNPFRHIWMGQKSRFDSTLNRILVDIENDALVYKLELNNILGMTYDRWTIEQNIRAHISVSDDYETDIEELFRTINPFIDYNNHAIISTCFDELVARMKPHLKQYFPLAPSHPMPLDELKVHLKSLF